LRDLAKRLLFQVLGRFVLGLHEVDLDQLERDLLLAQYSPDAARACRLDESVEFENHCSVMWV